MASKQDSKEQGFAAMDEDKRKAAASKGGKTSSRSADKDEDTTAKAKTNGSADVNGDAAKTKKGDSSAKAESDDADEGEELDQLLEALESGNLDELDPEEGLELIEEWQETLSKTKDEDLKEIGNSLKKLKKLLAKEEPKVSDLAELLQQVGQQTDSYGDKAERGYKTKLHKLGKALGKAGKALAQEGEE